jgi:hypothetical protein
VQLFVTDAPTDVIKVYNKYYAESALIQNNRWCVAHLFFHKRQIGNMGKANDLRSVSLFDNSQISSFGTLSKIEFSVDLHDNAQAKLNLNAFKLTLLVSNNAKADIKGAADEFNLNRAVKSKTLHAITLR